MKLFKGCNFLIMGFACSAFLLNNAMSFALPVCITPPLGDINHDGKVDASDVTLLKSCILNKSDPAADCSLTVADVNRDGKVTTLDVVVIQSTVMGKCTPAQDPKTNFK